LLTNLIYFYYYSIYSTKYLYPLYEILKIPKNTGKILCLWIYFTIGIVKETTRWCQDFDDSEIPGFKGLIQLRIHIVFQIMQLSKVISFVQIVTFLVLPAFAAQSEYVLCISSEFDSPQVQKSDHRHPHAEHTHYDECQNTCTEETRSGCADSPLLNYPAPGKRSVTVNMAPPMKVSTISCTSFLIESSICCTYSDNFPTLPQHRHKSSIILNL